MPDIISKGYSIASQVYGGITTIDNFLGQFGSKQPMGKRKSIDGFVANQLNKDLGRKAHYRVKMYPPVALGKTAHQVHDTMSLMASSSVFPDVSVVPGQITIANDFEYTTVNEINFADLPMVFYCDAEMTQRTFLEDWMRLSFPHRNGRGQPNYYNDYIGKLEIYQLKHNFLDDGGVGADDDWTYKAIIHDAYPSSIQTMDVAWDSTDFHKVEMNWSFRWFESETQPISTSTGGF